MVDPAEWHCVLCYEHCFKEELSEQMLAIGKEVRGMGGTLVRKKKALKFKEWWLDTCETPYILISDWREIKACFGYISNSTRSKFQRPLRIYVVASPGKSFQKASSWAVATGFSGICVTSELSPKLVMDWCSEFLAELNARRPLPPAVNTIGACQQSNSRSLQEGHDFGYKLATSQAFSGPLQSISPSLSPAGKTGGQPGENPAAPMHQAGMWLTLLMQTHSSAQIAELLVQHTPEVYLD
eukprot:TRINITY_DN110004_c0_g1_i1.p1 TRINITY_DN110004_c0_g1~~TRINITY_DN110004_c0_g1_i1.p1  ORF type:complete len:240 (-),score=40.84 TRINITY_DN110004_c0_g1_i1:18-737(-)